MIHGLRCNTKFNCDIDDRFMTHQPCTTKVTIPTKGYNFFHKISTGITTTNMAGNLPSQMQPSEEEPGSSEAGSGNDVTVCSPHKVAIPPSSKILLISIKFLGLIEDCAVFFLL